MSVSLKIASMGKVYPVLRTRPHGPQRDDGVAGAPDGSGRIRVDAGHMPTKCRATVAGRMLQAVSPAQAYAVCAITCRIRSRFLAAHPCGT